MLGRVPDSPLWGILVPITPEKLNPFPRPKDQLACGVSLLTALYFCPTFGFRKVFVLFEGKGMPLLLIYVFNIFIYF